MIGRLIGNYRVVAKLGEGGMGAVYLAEHPDISRKQAVKVLHPHQLRDPQAQSRFLNEARAASAIRHPNIVEIVDVGALSPEGTPYIAMEYLIGEDLAARLRRGPLGSAEAIDLGQQIAAALGAAHAQGVVHRDLKPANLFVIPDDNRPGSEKIKVLDFGVAKLRGALASSANPTQSGTFLGTPAYMSPEQCRGARDVDHRSDIYSLGAILYEMVCGRPPFVSSSSGELVIMHSTQNPDLPRRHNAAISEHLERIILRALAKQRDYRFATAAELQAALASALASRSGAMAAPFAPLVTPGPGLPAIHTVASVVGYPANAPAAAVSSPGSYLQASGPSAAMSPSGSYLPVGAPMAAMVPPSGGYPNASGPIAALSPSGGYPQASGPIAPIPSTGLRATRSAHYSVMEARALSLPVAKPASRAGLWALAGGGALAVVAGILFFFSRTPAAEQKPSASSEVKVAPPDAGVQQASQPPISTPPRPPPAPPPHRPQPSPARGSGDPHQRAGIDQPGRGSGDLHQRTGVDPPGRGSGDPRAHGSADPLARGSGARGSADPLARGSGDPRSSTDQHLLAQNAPQPPQGPAQVGIVEACARSCRRLGSCGLHPSATCEKSCTSSPRISACASNAPDDCNGAASCAAATLCSGVAPSGTATCNATFDCELRCGNDPGCACHCAQMLSPRHAMAWLAKRNCEAACRHDAACVQSRCSRSILACQAE